MRSDRRSELIDEIASRYGIPSYVLEKAWKNQFQVLKKVMSESDRNDVGTFKVVYMRGLGKFVPRFAEMLYMNSRKDGCKGDS
jgi:hypothetical protein